MVMRRLSHDRPPEWIDANHEFQRAAPLVVRIPFFSKSTQNSPAQFARYVILAVRRSPYLNQEFCPFRADGVHAQNARTIY